MSQSSPHVASGVRPSQGSLLMGMLFCVILAGLLAATFF